MVEQEEIRVVEPEDTEGASYNDADCAWYVADADTERDYGFLHRLDVPSSGLLIAAKTYEAFYDLTLQLNSGEVMRSTSTDWLNNCHRRKALES